MFAIKLSPKMRHLIAILQTIILATIFVACNDDNDHVLSLQMKDGCTISVEKDVTLDMKQGATKRNKEYDFSQKLETVRGYNECDSTSYWQRTTIGKWGKKFGLSTDKNYFSRIEYYYKVLPAQNDEVVKTYNFATEYTMGLYSKGYIMGSSIYNKPNVAFPLEIGYHCQANNEYIIGTYYIAYTAIVNIRYDGEGNTVNMYYPCHPDSLTWLFSRFKIPND